jgi:hypothetical protein
MEDGPDALIRQLHHVGFQFVVNASLMPNYQLLPLSLKEASLSGKGEHRRKE